MYAFTRKFLRKCINKSSHTRTLVNDSSVVRSQLRALLRDTAQPVAVVTALMDPTIPHAAHPSHTHNGPRGSRFHGATLSSFTSIALDPYPLVAFSLRIPSRMATSLAAAHAHGAASSAAHMVVNVLSDRQVETAVRFSRPDVHPEPFVGLSHSLTDEGLPVLDGCIGAMSCRLVAASWPLHDLASLVRWGKGIEGQGRQDGRTWEGDGVASELFIAQVVRVERTLSVEEEKAEQPLLYYRRGYVTTHPIDSKPSSSS